MTNEIFTYDVFVAYSADDRVWVRSKLLPRLEESGLRVCIDYRDFHRSSSTITEIERALRLSRKTLIVLSPHYQGSDWIDLEQFLLQEQHPINREKRIVPLLREHYTIPASINLPTYVDFTLSDHHEDRQIAWTQLLTALGTPPLQEAPDPPKREYWLQPHPYPLPPNFSGRVYERDQLTSWLNADYDHALLVLHAPAGFGKSMLAWQWLQRDVHPAHWRRVIWWDFAENFASFEYFLAEALTYLQAPMSHLSGPRQQADELLRLLREPEGENILLVLDSFERLLDAYRGMHAAYQGDRLPDTHQRVAINPLVDYFLRSLLAEPKVRGKLLLVSRLRPHALEEPSGVLLQGCRELEPGPLHPDNAIDFFRAQGVRGSRIQIDEICAASGYHPLSLALLAGIISNHPQQPGDITTAYHLERHGDQEQRLQLLLQQAFAMLSPACQHLLARIACFRHAISHTVLKTLNRKDEEEQQSRRESEQHTQGIMGFLKTLMSSRPDPLAPLTPRKRGEPALPREPDALHSLNTDLQKLVAWGLVLYDRHNRRYDLHPVVRHAIYQQLSDEERRTHHQMIWEHLQMLPPPPAFETLADMSLLLELYAQTVQLGLYDEAFKMFYHQLSGVLYYRFGAYQLQIELLRMLFPDGEAHPPRLQDERNQSYVLSLLANSYTLGGQPLQAQALYEQAMAIDERLGDRKNLILGLTALASGVQMPQGKFQAAEVNVRRAINMSQRIGDEFQEAVGHQELGRLLAYRGNWEESESELSVALTLFERLNHTQGQGVTLVYRTQRLLLLARLPLQEPPPAPALGLQSRVSRPSAEDTAVAATPLPTAAVALPDGTRGSDMVQPVSPAAEQAANLQAETPQAEQRRQATTDALLTAQRALALIEQVSPADYLMERDYLLASWVLGAACRINDNLSEADGHLQEALHRCRKINAHIYEADILLELARLKFATAAREEARLLARQALDISERCGYVLQAADTLLFQAQMLFRQGDQPGAQELAKKVKEYARCDGPPNATYKVAYDEAGMLLVGMKGAKGDMDEPRPL